MIGTRRKALHVFLAASFLILLYTVTSNVERLRAAPVAPGVGQHSKAWSQTPIGQKPQRIQPAVSKLGTFHYPVTSFIPLPTGKPATIPRIQHDFRPEDAAAKWVREVRLRAVKDAFEHSWRGYKKHAWLKDELSPISGGSRMTFGGWAATLVDSLDALWILGMKSDFEEAVNAASQINFNSTGGAKTLNVFETTIRYLGGFLGAYDVSGGQYPVLLEKAIEVAEMLYDAFDTPNRMPITRWERTGVEVASSNTLLAELGSMSLEFTRLSQITGDPKYYDAIQRITDELDKQQIRTKLPGMWPVSVNAREIDFTGDTGFTLGGMSDSTYEYLPKEHLLLGGLVPQYQHMYQSAMEPIKEHLFFKPMTPDNADILISGNVRVVKNSIELDPQAQHLACFVGGMVALGAQAFSRPDELKLAARLVNGCIWSYKTMPTGIAPELMHVLPCPDTLCAWNATTWGHAMISRNSFDETPSDKDLPFALRTAQKAQRLRLPQGISAIGDKRYLLRPEAVESVFVLWRITGDAHWREAGWAMFEAIVAETRTEIAYTAIDDVTWPHSPRSDKMESFWLAETLKYFYLLFEEPGVVSLDEFVVNTEAHPLRRPS